MINTALSFEDYLIEANRADTKEKLFEVYTKAVAQHGLDRILLCLATDHRDIGESSGMNFMHNFPMDWMDYYFEKGFDKIDPVMIYSLNQMGSYRWNDIPENMELNKTQEICLNMGEKEGGLYSGICTPLRGPNHAVAGLSLASSHKKDNFDGNMDLITAYSNHFYLAYRRLGEKEVSSSDKNLIPNIALTEREREILTWAARGKSRWDISEILSISAHTVDYHMRKVFKKLEVNEHTLAVIKALTYGLIHP